MNAHTHRMFLYMLSLIDGYLAKEQELATIVNGLEGCINAIEEKIPEDFRTTWYIHWGGLEQILAAGTQQIRDSELEEDVKSLKDLLSQFLMASKK